MQKLKSVQILTEKRAMYVDCTLTIEEVCALVFSQLFNPAVGYMLVVRP